MQMVQQRSISIGSGRGGGGGGGGGRPGHGEQGDRGTRCLSRYLYQDRASDDEDQMMDTTTSDKHNKFYNRATPWSPPPNAANSIFHVTEKQTEAPLVREVRSFTSTLKIGFNIGYQC
jgi:hypothetical protein